MQKDLIDEVINSPKVDAQLTKLKERLEGIVKLIGTINKAGKGVDFSKGFTEAAKAAQEARAAAEELRKEREALRKQEQELRNTIQQLNVEIAKERLERQKLSTAQAKERAEKKALKDAMVGEKGSIIDLRNTLKSLQAQYDKLGPAARKAMAGRDLLSAIKATDAELKKLEATTGRFQRNVGNYPKVVGGISSLLGSFGVTLGAGAIAKQVFDTTSQLDNLDSVLTSVSKNSEQLAINQKFLSDITERLGLNVIDTTKSFNLFYAAATESGLTANQAREIFQAAAESSAYFKLSTEDTNGVLLAFSQILGKGKVQAEELRGQIGERIPGAFAIAARAIGKTEAELNKMLEQGQVIASDFLPKFAKELEKNFGVDGTVDTLAGSTARLSNEFTALVNNNQSGLSKFFKSIVDGARGALAGFNSFLEKLQGPTTLHDANGNPISDLWGDALLQEQAKQRREQLASENDSFIEEFKNASAERRKVLLEEAEKLEAVTLKFAKSEFDATKGALNTGNPFDLMAATGASGKAIRASEAAFQEQNRAQRMRQILAEENAPASKNTKTPTKAEENAAARLRERQRKALLDAQGIDLQMAIDSQKEIFENEKASLDDRLNALATYYDLREQLINVNLDGEKKKEKLLPEEVKLLEKKAEDERIKNRREFWKLYADTAKSGADEQTKVLLAAQQKQSDELSNAEDQELLRATELLKNKAITEEEFELLGLQIKNKYDNLRLKAELDTAKKLLKIRQDAGEPVEEELKRITDLENQIRDADLKYYEDSEKKKTDALQKQLETRRDLEQQYHDRINTLRQDGLNLANEIVSGFFEKEKNRVQERIDLIDQQKEKEIESVNQSVQNEQEKEARISAINQTAQVKKEALERRQREIDQRAALFQKFMSLLQIGITTAETVFKIQAQGAILAANPITAALAPQAYAQIPLVIASGLLQAAAIAAKPIPKYAEGTENHPGGWAELGDGYKNELIVHPDGSMSVSPNVPTYMNLEKGTKVIPSFEEALARYPGLLFPQIDHYGGRQVDDPAIAEKIVKGVGKDIRELKSALMSRPSERTLLTERGLQHQVYRGNKWHTYINRNVKGLK